MVANAGFFGKALIIISAVIGLGTGLITGTIAWLIGGVWAGLGFGVLALVIAPIITWKVWLR
jgi:hypothetical protein